jgi:glycosyltransferase involved in cell wall biosynthesis
MHILLVTDSYPPEIRSASHLMLELAQELQRRGHEVTVITTWPEYNLDQAVISKKFQPLENENGIRVIRVKTLPHHNVNYIVRAVSQLLMPLQFLTGLWRHKIHADALIIYSPPLPLALVGSWLRRSGVRTLLNIQDLFPQNAIDLGILRSKFQIKFFQAIECFAYYSADLVTVHSEGNRRMLLKQYPQFESKIKLLHNWVDVEHHRVSHVGIDFRKKWGITQKHIAVFAGVMGPSQYLDLILNIAEHMQDRTDLLFLLVGDGKERLRLEQLAAQKSLKNVRFEGFISRDVYPDLLNICSIGLVCLSPQNMTPVVPGKILGHMAAGLPVAAFLHASSDAHEMIAAASCGVSTNSGDLDACVLALQKLLANETQFVEIGQRGRSYALEHFSKEVCVSQIENMLSQH